jgi:hypothetical protein
MKVKYLEDIAASKFGAAKHALGQKIRTAGKAAK